MGMYQLVLLDIDEMCIRDSTYTDLIFWFLATSAVMIADRIGRRLPSSANSPAKTALLTSLWLSAPLIHKIDKAMGRSK